MAFTCTSSVMGVVEMITVFDQDEVLEDYIASVKREQTEQNTQITAKNLHIKKHMSIEEIADVLGYSTKMVEKWLQE